MSQAGIISVASMPAVPTTFVTDSGNAVPALNILNVVTPGSGTNGITTTGAGSTLTISLTNRISGTVTTNDAVPTTAFTLALGATPGTYTFDLRAAGFDAANNLSVGYTLVTAVRTTGAASVLVVPIGSQMLDEFEEAALNSADFYVDVAGNNALLQVVGVAAHTINWKVEGTYTFVS